MSTETLMREASSESGSARLAREIRAEMGRQRISTSELARRLGRSRSTVDRWTASGSGLDFDTIEEVAAALGVSTADLVAAARFRCTQPSSDPAFPSQLRRHGAGVERYTGPLRRASDCVA